MLWSGFYALHPLATHRVLENVPHVQSLQAGALSRSTEKPTHQEIRGDWAGLWGWGALEGCWHLSSFAERSPF